MARLPKPNSDKGIWGEILNDYLSVAHHSDGTLKPGTIDTAQLADGSVTRAKVASAGQANGIATLDAGATLPEAQLPARLSASTLSAQYAPVYYDDSGNFTSRGAVQTINRNLPNPINLQPSFWSNVSGKGDNTTFKGVAAGQFLARDRSDVTAANKGVLYGVQAVAAPRIDRDNVPYDDVVGVSIENQGSAIGTDALYFGKNRADKAANPNARDWANIIQCDANAGNFIRAIGTYDHGISFTQATFTTAAIRLGNDQSISSNDSAGTAKRLFRLTPAGTFRIGEQHGGLDVRAAYGGIYMNAKVVMPNDTALCSIRNGTTQEYQLIRLTTSDNVSLFDSRVVIPSGGGVVVQNITTTPPTPTAGGVLYIENGALKYKGSAGTVTTLAPA